MPAVIGVSGGRLLAEGLLGGEQCGDLLGELWSERAPAVLVAVDGAQRPGLVVATEDVDVLAVISPGWATPTDSETLISSLRKV